MILKLIFGEPRDVTNPRQDGVQYLFPFTMIDSELIGTPEQRSLTQERRFIIRISRSRLTPWRIAPANLPRILFEFGRRHIAGLIESRELPDGYTIRCPMVSTASHPDSSCPFDPALIPEPAGFTMEVEQRKPPMGFNFKSTK